MAELGEEEDGLLSLFLETRASFLRLHQAEMTAKRLDVRPVGVRTVEVAPVEAGAGARARSRSCRAPSPAKEVQRRMSRIVKVARLPTGLVWQLARAGIKASAIAHHAVDIIDGILDRAGRSGNLVVIKIGISQDVRTRCSEYLADGFHALHVLAEIPGLAAGMLETLLIGKYRSLSYGRCWNQHDGGEGILAGGLGVERCWTYVAVKYVE
jgi:hypothetical protein